MFCSKHAAKKTSPMCCNTPGLLFGRFRLKGEPDNRTAARVLGSLTSLVTDGNCVFPSMDQMRLAFAPSCLESSVWIVPFSV